MKIEKTDRRILSDLLEQHFVVEMSTRDNYHYIRDKKSSIDTYIGKFYPDVHTIEILGEDNAYIIAQILEENGVDKFKVILL